MENCPSWICNQWGVPQDYVYLFTAIIVFIPYFLFLFYLYKKTNETSKSGCFFFVTIPITAILYCGFLCGPFLHSNNNFLNFIGAVIYGSAMYMVMAIPLSIIGLITIPFLNFDEEEDDEDFEED